MEEIKKEKKALTWLNIAHFTNDIYTGFLNPIMPFIAEQLNFSMPIATIILSCSHIFSSILQPLFGFFADKIKKRALIFWGLIFTSFFIPHAPASSNIAQLLIFIILGSLGSSLFHPQALGCVVSFAKNDTVKKMGLFISMGTLGFSIGPLMSSYVAQYFGLAKMPYLSILGTILALSMFLFIPKFTPEKSNNPSINLKQAFFEILSNRKLNILNIISMLKSLITTSCSILLPFLWKAQGYSKFQIGLAMFFFLFFGGFGSLLSSRFEKKIGTANVFYFSMITTCPMMILFMLTYETLPALSFVIYVLMGFVTMFATPITMSMAQRVLPEYKSIIGGFINGFSWGVVALVMTVIGYIAQATKIVPVLVVISVIPVISSTIVKHLFQEN